MRWLLAFLLVLATVPSYADGRVYGDLRLGAAGVRHSDIDFYSSFGSLTAGVFILRNIGIEAFVDLPLSTQTKGAFDVGIASASGIAIRLQSPPQHGVRAYLALGYVAFGIEQNENDARGQRRVKSDFEGASILLGVHKQLAVAKPLKIGIEYRNFYSDTGITVDGLSLGLRFEYR